MQEVVNAEEEVNGACAGSNARQVAHDVQVNLALCHTKRVASTRAWMSSVGTHKQIYIVKSTFACAVVHPGSVFLTMC